MTKKQFGNACRYFRHKAGKSQRQVGQELYRRPSNCYHWEAGVAMPSLTTFLNLMDVLGVTIEEFVSYAKSTPS